MTCSCSKPLKERTVATKTHDVNGVTIVDASRQALVCDSCGVVAWDPPTPVVTGPYRPYAPWIPATLPFTGPNVSPNMYPPYLQRFGAICGTADASTPDHLRNARVVN